MILERRGENDTVVVKKPGDPSTKLGLERSGRYLAYRYPCASADIAKDLIRFISIEFGGDLGVLYWSCELEHGGYIFAHFESEGFIEVRISAGTTEPSPEALQKLFAIRQILVLVGG